jgi:ATP phosphoribosyltransferase
MRFATSFPNISRRFFESKGKKIEIVNVGGAAEIMPYLGVSDGIVDLVSSGATLRTNRLVEVETLLQSQAVVVTSKGALAKKKDAIMDIVNSVKSVIDAENKKYLMADVPKDKLDEVEKIIPGIGGPTVLPIAGNSDYVAVQAVIDNKDVFKTIAALKKLGAKGTLTTPIERLVN